jgi:hypothetical protein
MGPLMLFLSIFSCAAVSAQERVDGFQSLITSPSIQKKSDITVLELANYGVVKKEVRAKVKTYPANFRVNKSDLRRDVYVSGFSEKLCREIDSLGIVDYAKDTVFIIESGYLSLSSNRNVLIVTKQGMFIANTCQIDKFEYPELKPKQTLHGTFSPLTIEPILKWDVSGLSDVMYSLYMVLKRNDSGRDRAKVRRIVVDNYQKMETSVLFFDSINYWIPNDETLEKVKNL